jgi:maleylacetoacetate isomerase/maleylpyruvate isomerase
MSMKLHNYFRSSASYRVRIALNLKGLAFDYIPVHLSRDGGEQFTPAFRSVNAEALVPVLRSGGDTLTQSLAIIEYLDEVYPDPPLLPATAGGRARVRSLAQAIACDIHPLNNLRVLRYLTGSLGLSDEVKNVWYRHWVALGLEALEARLSTEPATGRFCHGEQPGLADCCLVPQLYNARRFQCDLSTYPTLLAIEDHCQALDAFLQAMPDRQPDGIVD